jgi:tetratricopeptide (TPR) repeat protein
MFNKIITVVLLIIQTNAIELKVTEEGIKLIEKNKLINTDIKNSAIAYSYQIEKKSFEGSDFILYKDTYLNSSTEQCLIPIYKTNLAYKLTKAYCLDFVISYTEYKKIPMFYIYDLRNLYLRNFKDELYNHPMKKKYIYNDKHTEFIFPNLISYDPYDKKIFTTDSTCIVPGSRLENYNFEKLSCRKETNVTLKTLEKILKQKKDLTTYSKEFFKKLLPEKPIENKTLTTYNNIAYYLQKAGANEEAIYLLKKILEKYPTRTVAHYNLADAYWELGEKKKAIASYTTYIEQMCDAGKEKRIPQVVRDRVSSK